MLACRAGISHQVQGSFWMVHGFTCDRCNGTLLLDSDVRYVVRIEIFAAYDPMEIAPSDLNRDCRAEMGDLIARMETMDPEELQDQVHRHFQFDLCPTCQREYLENPLGQVPPPGAPPPEAPPPGGMADEQ